ncbi:unnamed protein product [Brugia pahangi]|uniref:Secreted protein n=1 Tax=Brugia pahangi TaxID=6280 RepID=A0A0N4SY97_BRUPA|nr:unnamed protein product [Brugia pahangi]
MVRSACEPARAGSFRFTMRVLSCLPCWEDKSNDRQRCMWKLLTRIDNGQSTSNKRHKKDKKVATRCHMTIYETNCGMDEDRRG